MTEEGGRDEKVTRAAQGRAGEGVWKGSYSGVEGLRRGQSSMCMFVDTQPINGPLIDGQGSNNVATNKT